MNYDFSVTGKLKITHEGLEEIVIDLADTAMTVWQGTSRYAEVKPGGGHWETSTLSGVSDHPGGFETENDFLLVHQVAT
jgi:hypothetical protein